MKREELIYWGVTGVFCAFFTFGGFGHLFRIERMAEGMAALGYPGSSGRHRGVTLQLSACVRYRAAECLLECHRPVREQG